ncbi:hypothetical protein [Streptomyces tagetis]|uniref:hypothetical protein n=1 Tax=Streptomyces tagetis TaxID=2820809 RepID=UPI001B3636B1|nr:hypothetical protein [Streptomyces sp. RG38]
MANTPSTDVDLFTAVESLRRALDGAGIVPPDPVALAEDQLRGALCVWCSGPLTLATAVNLGELDSPRGRWWPRACPACAGTRAHRALFTHAPECADCQATPAGRPERPLRHRPPPVPPRTPEPPMTHCDTCGPPIQGKPHVIIIDSPSGATPNLTIHPEPCRTNPPRHTTPVHVRRRPL